MFLVFPRSFIIEIMALPLDDNFVFSDIFFWGDIFLVAPLVDICLFFAK